MKVSIIIPLYNKENYIEETLNSVLNQSYKDWECIIIDDNSTDSSLDMVKKFLSDIRFIKLVNPRKGASAARNFGIKHSRGDYIQFLDADDIISKNKLKAQLDLLRVSNKLSIATCKWGRFNEKYELYENLKSYSNFNEIPELLDSLILSKGYFPLNVYLFPRVMIQSSGMWNENLTLNDDGEFVLRVLTHSDNIVFANNAIAWYRTATCSNLSSYQNINNVVNAIYSWQLIEALLKIKYGSQASNFVEWSKDRFYVNIKSYHPHLLSMYKSFFSRSIINDKNNKRLILRVRNKIVRLLR